MRGAILSLVLVGLCGATVPTDNDVTIHRRSKRNSQSEMTRIRNMSPSDRPNCQPGVTPPNIQVDTTQRLSDLRNRFTVAGIHGYLVPSEDAHQSEYPSNYDLRRAFISGMSGSAGRAVILQNKAALWTDGRYFLQAEDELDCNWIFMKQGENGVPTVTEWVEANLMDGQSLGANTYLIKNIEWTEMSETLAKKGITVKGVTPDLIDEIWTTGRPAEPNSPINALPLKYAGKSWQEKINNMHVAMEAKEADIMVVTGLDETAWLFNLRASDIDYNPFLVSYALVNRPGNSTILYIKNAANKLVATPTDAATTETVQEHLNTGSSGSCNGRVGMCVTVKEYSNQQLQTDINAALSSTTGYVWVSFGCSRAVYSSITATRVLQGNTPAALQKAQKNTVEQQGMRNSHIRDAVALIKFLAKLEKEVKEKKHWTEVSAAADLKQHRFAVKDNRGLSFPTIAGSGSNGAIIHYFPTNDTDKAITTSDMFLLDSGGQYLDGTTDVTRTLHFGNPTAYEKECYTRVLMGHVDLADFVFTGGHLGREIDTIARRPLWDVGLQYRHGTGHGIGMYLSVHEGPGRISLSHASFIHDEPLDEFQFFSDEPGYYEDGKFGIRLENIVMIKKATTKYQFPGTTFFTFETVTMVPYEPHLIVKELLSQREVDWINAYHKTVQDTISPLVSDDALATSWLLARTKPISLDNETGTGHQLTALLSLVMLACVTHFIL
ncbi:xaa-Pro aminopeptidase 1-like isoform X1 [Mizuhopecten yessoensis]|uniref:xaa-Pro aminopeptidase 1-like isoform X1 n=1 Tax=Mizuhopecten yessoensis TaxID=6573 RepID=UPI000B45E857|nr:xaa-Pro aminopeptidase 1-like isoform X1 [Mizuhopecten yessoensis]